jgi:uncharacterized membrane protein
VTRTPDRTRSNRLSVSASFSAYQGLLPPPEMLAQFNQVIPNGADRIVSMAESQQQHRQALESAVVNGNVIAQRRGQLFGFLLGLVAIVGGIGLIAFDKSTQGLVAIITAFVALAAVFVYGRYEQERERERKRREAREASAQQRLPLD